MLNWIKGALVGWVLGILTVLVGAGSYRIVQTETGLRIIPRESWGFQESYVDTRSWGALDYMHHRELSRDLVRAGVKDLTGSAEKAARQTKDEVQNTIESARKEIERGVQQARQAVRNALEASPSR